MSLRCSAVYEQGVFRPLTRPELSEGEEVEIIIVPARMEGEVSIGETPGGESQATPAERLAAIAAMPLETDDEGFSGTDHDEILYGANCRP